MDIHGTDLKKIKQELDRLYSEMDTMVADSVGYGGPLEVYKDMRTRVSRILDLFSDDLKKELHRTELRHKAAALRREAKALEEEANQ